MDTLDKLALRTTVILSILFNNMGYIKSLYSGRISPSRWFFGSLFIGVLYLFVYLCADRITQEENLTPFLAIVFLAAVLVFVPLSLLYFFGLSVRRLHDIGQDGLWSLFLLIPFVDIVMMFYLWLKDGHKAENKYGKQPGKHTSFFEDVFYPEHLT